MIRKITQGIILVSVALWICWDIYANQTHGATESEVVRDWQLAYPSISWGLGVVFGHLTLLGRRIGSPLFLVPLSAAILALTLLVSLSWPWVPALGLLGVAAGRIFWAQKPRVSYEG